MGKKPADYFGTFEYVHKRSGRKVRQDVFPFHNYAFQEGLLHAENLGGDLDTVLGKRCIIGAFPGAMRGSRPVRAASWRSSMPAMRRSKRSAMPRAASSHP